MNDTPPLVSVLMPVCDTASYLGAAIESVRAQTCADFELLILDDGSRDNSRAIAAAFAARDRRIRILPPHTTNRGESAARTALLDAARGAFIAWLDSDDVSGPDRITQQLEYLRRNASIDAVGTGVVVADANLTPIERRTFAADAGMRTSTADVCFPSLMLRAGAAKATGRFRDGFSAGAGHGDSEWMLRFCDRFRVTNIDEHLYVYRQRPDAETSGHARRARANVLASEATAERRAGRADPLDAWVAGNDLEHLRDEVFLQHPRLATAEKLAALDRPLAGHSRLVSILMPFQDHHIELHHALVSLASQSLRNFEVVIFDNGSSPRLEAADINLANMPFPTRLLRAETRLRGYQVCQALVDAAEGQFLLWHRADCYSRNDRLEVLLTYMLEHPDCLALGSGVNYVRKHIEKVVRSQAFKARAFDAGQFEGEPHTFMLRRAAIEQAGPFGDADWFPLDSSEFLARIQPQSAVHNLFGYMLQVFPNRPQIDDAGLWRHWLRHRDAPRLTARTVVLARRREMRDIIKQRTKALQQTLRSALNRMSQRATATARTVDPASPAIIAKPIIVRLRASSGEVGAALDRLLPGKTRRWKNVEFVVGDGSRADYHVMLNYPPQPLRLNAPANRVWFAIGEPPTDVHRVLHRAAGRGTVVLTCDEQFARNPAAEPRRHVLTQCMTPTWSVDRTIEQLRDGPTPTKTQRLSWVTSSIGFLPGHRYRMQFLERMRGNVEFDLYGRGFTPLADKWDGLAPYRYSMAFENFRNATYFSEKLMDCIVTETLPIYHGCSEISRYLPAKAVWTFDPEDRHVMRRISELIESNEWQNRLSDLREAKELVLTKYNMFISIAELIAADNTPPDKPRDMVINPILVDFRDA